MKYHGINDISGTDIYKSKQYSDKESIEKLLEVTMPQAEHET